MGNCCCAREKVTYLSDEEFEAEPVDFNEIVYKKKVLKKAAEILEVDLGREDSVGSYHNRIFRHAVCLATLLGELEHVPEDGAAEQLRPSKKQPAAMEDPQARNILKNCLVILEAWKTEERKVGEGGTQTDTVRLEVLKKAAETLGVRFELGESTRAYHNRILQQALHLAMLLAAEKNVIEETCQSGAASSSTERPRGDAVCFEGQKVSTKRIAASVQKIQSVLKQVV